MAPVYPCCFFLEPLAPLPFPLQAVELLRHALKEYEGSLGNDHPQTLNCAGQPRGLRIMGKLKISWWEPVEHLIFAGNGYDLSYLHPSIWLLENYGNTSKSNGFKLSIFLMKTAKNWEKIRSQTHATGQWWWLPSNPIAQNEVWSPGGTALGHGVQIHSQLCHGHLFPPMFVSPYSNMPLKSDTYLRSM